MPPTALGEAETGTHSAHITEQIFSSKEGRGPYDKIVPKYNINMVLKYRNIYISEKNLLNTLLIA